MGKELAFFVGLKKAITTVPNINIHNGETLKSRR